MKQVHIVVHDGLVQAVYTDADVAITIHDLDTDDRDDYLETKAFIAQVAKYVKQVY